MMKLVVRMTLPMLEKARKSPRLVPITRMVTRGGKTFPQTVWMLPEDVKAGRTSGAQGSLFDDVGPAPVIQGDLFDQAPDEPEKEIATKNASGGMYLRVEGSRTLVQVESLKEASEKFAAVRDAVLENGGGGASKTPRVDIVDGNHKVIGIVSYNGRIWKPEDYGKTGPDIHPIYDNRKLKPASQDVSGVRMADGGFPKDVLRDGEKIGRVTEARLNGKVVGYNVRNLQGELVGNAKTPEEALAKFKDGIKKEEPTEPDKSETKTVEQEKKSPKDMTREEFIAAFKKDVDFPLQGITPKVEKRAMEILAADIPSLKGKDIRYAQEKMYQDLEGWASAIHEAWQDVKNPHADPEIEKKIREIKRDIKDGVTSKESGENRIKNLEARQDENLPVGSTKTENGVTYRLNENHRWEKVEEDTTDPKMKKIMEDWNRDAKESYITPSDIASDYKTSPAWIKKQFDAMVDEGKLVRHDNGKKVFYAIPGTKGAKTLEERKAKHDEDQAKIDRIAEKLKQLSENRKNETNTEPEKIEPKPIENIPTGEAGFEDMKKRITTGPHTVIGKYMQSDVDGIFLDGQPVAKFTKWFYGGEKGARYGISDLKERKSRSRSNDPGEIIEPCKTKEEALEKYIMKMFNDEQEKKAREAENKERAKKIRDAKRQAAIGNATPATRVEVQKAIEDDGSEKETKPKTVEPYNYTPKMIEFESGQLHKLVADYTDVIPSKVSLVNKKKILDTPRPSYIPEINESTLNKMHGRIEGVKLGTDRYLIAIDRGNDGDAPSYIAKYKGEGKFALVNLVVLTATQDYYTKLRNAKHDLIVRDAVSLGESMISIMKKLHEKGVDATQEDAEKEAKEVEMLKGKPDFLVKEFAKKALLKYQTYQATNQRLINNGRPGGYSFEGFVKNTMESIQSDAKRSKPKTISMNKATYSHLAMIPFVKPEASTESLKWREIQTFNADMKQMSIDLNLQMEEDENAYSKGRETSYGRKGTVNDMYDSHGVVVKRQNGDAITPVEVEELRKALDAVYSVYGDRSSLAKKENLLLSHSGEVRMHARKAFGIYISSMNAIGVTWMDGQKGAGFTLAHEFAHFMDNKLGELGKRFNYASDDRQSLEYEIADNFRRSMAEKQESDYQNRTCECFARALEQYFSIETGDATDYQVRRNSQGNHPEHNVYMERVYPLVKRFFAEKGELLKSIRVWRFTK